MIDIAFANGIVDIDDFYMNNDFNVIRINTKVCFSS